jgi:multidrug efflux pump subunit AcrA (membrane-fusion protein)
VKKSLKQILVMAAAATVVGLAVWGFAHGRQELAAERERERPVTAPSRVSFTEGVLVVIMDADSRRKADLATAPLVAIAHEVEQEAFAVVLSAQELVDLHNQYAGAQAPLAKARALASAAQAEFLRRKSLYESQRAVSQTDYQNAEASWRSEQAAVDAAVAAVAAVRATARQQWGAILGQAIEGSPLYTRLAEYQDSLLQVTLAADVDTLKAPSVVRLRLPSNTWREATFISVAPRTDARMQGLSFYYRASPAGLSPGMTLQALLPTAIKQTGTVIPRSAIVAWEGKSWAYVEQVADRFVRREVTSNVPTEGGWFVDQGFSPGDQVVVRGAQLLLSEELRAQIQVGEEGGKPGD